MPVQVAKPKNKGFFSLVEKTWEEFERPGKSLKDLGRV
jgi:hypothetical protein